LDPETSGRLRGLTNATRDLLERHADKEHKLVFPMIERLLDPEQMAAAGERMRALRRESD
jgi:hemerythrin-like domain-containing protein